MMTLKIALRLWLLGKSQIVGVVGDRVLIGRVVPEQEAHPLITLWTDDADREQCLDGEPVNLTWDTLHIEGRAVSGVSLDSLMDLVRRAVGELESGATITSGDESLVIEETSILQAPTDDDPVTVTRDGHTSSVQRSVMLVEFGYRSNMSAIT